MRAGGTAQDGKEGRVEMPTAAAILKFALPTLAMRLCSPLLSLIDSAVVGRFGTAAQLAALAPGTIVCDSSAYVLTFLGIAATNLYATALADGRPDEAFRVLNNALALAVLSGTVLSISIYFLAPYALVAFTGSSASDVLVGARRFAEIRAVGTAGGIITMVTQALCFGDKDAITPLRAVLLSFTINLVGALVLVQLLPCPIVAVAVSTVVSQWTGAFYMLSQVAKQQRKLQQQTGAQLSRAQEGGAFFTLSIPEFSALREFVMFAGPGFFALLGKVICYSSMTAAAAAAGTLSLAAHQVVIQVFFFFCNIGDTMSNTAQAFLPGLMSKGDLKSTRQVITTLVFVGSLIGLVDATLAAAGVACMGHIFTTSAPVLELMHSLVGYLAISLVLHANVVALEGVLFAARQGQYLALAYAASTAVFSGACHSVCLPLCLCLCAVLPLSLSLPLCLSLSLDRDVLSPSQYLGSVSSSFTYW